MVICFAARPVIAGRTLPNFTCEPLQIHIAESAGDVRADNPYAASVTDVLARVLALSGLTVSIGSLGWQFTNYRLTGARVRCELRLALCTDSNPAGTLDILAKREDRLQWVLDADRDEFPHEAALITVRNLGRTAVSVHYPGLLIGIHRGGEGTTPQGFTMPTGFCRLDPGEAKTWLTPIWPTLDGWARLGLDRDTPLVMRAAVQLGTGRWQRSPRRNSWVIPAAVTSLEQAARTLADRGNAWRPDRGRKPRVPLHQGSHGSDESNQI